MMDPMVFIISCLLPIGMRVVQGVHLLVITSMEPLVHLVIMIVRIKNWWCFHFLMCRSVSLKHCKLPAVDEMKGCRYEIPLFSANLSSVSYSRISRKAFSGNAHFARMSDLSDPQHFFRNVHGYQHVRHIHNLGNFQIAGKRTQNIGFIAA